jgi:hypothetical protein
LGIFIYETLMSLRHTKVNRNLKLETGGKAESETGEKCGMKVNLSHVKPWAESSEINEINQIFG